MQSILLDEGQTSVIAGTRESIQVCDNSGTVLGHIVPTAAGFNYRFEWERWRQSWDHWCLECSEPPRGDHPSD